MSLIDFNFGDRPASGRSEGVSPVYRPLLSEVNAADGDHRPENRCLAGTTAGLRRDSIEIPNETLYSGGIFGGSRESSDRCAMHTVHWKWPN